MNFQPSGAQQQQRMSLREEAMARAAAAARGQGDPAEAPPVHPLDPAQQQFRQPSSPVPAQVVPNATTTAARAPSIHPPPAAPPAPSASRTTTTAEEARKTWRLHGEHASQVLEDRRSNLLAFPPPTNPDAPPPLVGSESLFGEGYSVRVIATDTRIDPSGAPYVVYVVSVETNHRPSSSSAAGAGGGGGRTVVEHRYSEFAKLHAELRANGVRTRASFPSKSWAGRVGNWTPSATIAPERAEELVVYRKAKLDIWLVELCELLNGTEIRGEVREGVLEFLRVSGGAGRPPCDRANPVSWDGLGGGDDAAALVDGSAAIAAAQVRNGARHAAGTEKSLSNPLSFTLGGSIRQATYTVMRMCSSSSKINATDQSIPLDLLHNAKGLCFLTVAKAGFVVSGRLGTGLIVARQSDGSWSPPSAVGTVGVGWGALIGGDITDYLLVLNTEKAVQAFATTKKGTVNLGAELGAAVGPVGRGATGTVSAAGDVGICPVYAYAHSKGLFVGISLEGSVVTSRPDVNAKFYGRPIGPAELLFGHSQRRPRAAKALYDALDEAMGVTIPEEGFRPSQMFAQESAAAAQGRRGRLQAPVLHVSQSSGDIVAAAAATTADLAVGRPPAETTTVR